MLRMGKESARLQVEPLHIKQPTGIKEEGRWLAWRTFSKWCTMVSSGSGAKLTRRVRLSFLTFLRCLLGEGPSSPPAGGRLLSACTASGRWSEHCARMPTAQTP